MLSSKHSLNRGEIALISRRGAVYQGRGLTIRVYKFAGLANSTRLAIVVSTKVAKTATGRNLIKRRLRHICRLLTKKLPAGYGIVLITRPDMLKQTFTEMKATVEAIFKQAHLFLTD